MRPAISNDNNITKKSKAENKEAKEFIPNTVTSVGDLCQENVRKGFLNTLFIFFC